MTYSDQQILTDACENPEAFINMAEPFLDHPEDSEKLLAEYLAKIKLKARIKSASLKMKSNLWSNQPTPTVIFQLKGDSQKYQLFGVLDNQELIHVVLATYDPSQCN